MKRLMPGLIIIFLFLSNAATAQVAHDSELFITLSGTTASSLSGVLIYAIPIT